MPATALLFPGQGSQVPGMGAALAERYPAARAVFERADDALGFGLSKLCFEGPASQLQKTEITQPAILAVSVATLAALRERGVSASFVAGHSLGEYSALVAAGSLQFRDAVRLVHLRGKRMQEAVPQGVGAMAALLGISGGIVARLCEEAAGSQVVAPANFNSPAQTVIAGHAGAVRRAVSLAKKAGARRAVLLNVSAPFHCSLMRPAQEAMEPVLDATDFADLRVGMINNCQAAEVRSGEAAREGLKRQIPNPVKWHQSIDALVARGAERFIEVGPGRVLTGLMRGIDRSLAAASTHNPASIERVSK